MQRVTANHLKNHDTHVEIALSPGLFERSEKRARDKANMESELT